MLSDNLYSNALIAPARDGANELLIVSGYATSAMCIRHLADLRQIRSEASIRLIVGMCGLEGLSSASHAGFRHLAEDNSFQCKYVYKGAPVHSKVFVWRNGSIPVIAFTGSANYTQTAFGMAVSKQREVLTPVDAQIALAYFNTVETDTITCDHIDAENLVTIYRHQARQRPQPTEEDQAIPPEYFWLPTVTLPVSVHRRSGLNWGQRDGRDPNQAYLPIPISIRRRSFFPPRTVRFTILTDDGKTLTAVVAQDYDKAIHTPYNNAELGLYFRRRLGVPDGAFVTNEHLARYGRDSVVIYKIDDETYFMDFSSPNG